MKVEDAIKLLKEVPDLYPLTDLLSRGRGLSLEEFCRDAEFAPKVTTGAKLAELLEKARDAGESGGQPQGWAEDLIAGAKGPVLNSTILKLGGAKGRNLGETRNRLRTYLVNGELPKPPAKKKAARKPAAIPEEVAREASELHRKLRGKAAGRSLAALREEFDTYFKKRTNAVLKAVLSAEGYTTDGTKKQLLDRLFRPILDISGDAARADF